MSIEFCWLMVIEKCRSGDASALLLRSGITPFEDDRETIEALDALERFAWVAEPSEMIRTLEWALKDPALESIRADWSPDFDAVVRLRTTKPKAGDMPVDSAASPPRAPGTLTKQMAGRRDDEPPTAPTTPTSG